MKKNVSLILSILMLLLVAAPALAGSDDILNVATAQISRGELDRLKAMVAGEPVPAAQAPASEYLADLGVVQVPRDDLNLIRAMIAGTYVAPVKVAAGEPMVDVGKVVMSRPEFEALKHRVSHHLHEVHALIASAGHR